MAVLPLGSSRVSSQAQAAVALSSIASTQKQLLQVQNELSTGKKVNVPSDDPAAAAIIQQLQQSLSKHDAYNTNIQAASSHLGQVDSTLGTLTDLITQAQGLASANVGSDVTDAQRQSAAVVLQSIITQALSIANTQFHGVYIFGGDRSTIPPFTQDGTGIKYVGSPTVLQNHFDAGNLQPFMVDGNNVFGALTTQVAGTANLSPALTATTRLIDVKGASGDGVRAGAIRLGNGVSTIDIDLSTASTVGDVVAKINTAAFTAGFAGVSAAISGTAIQIAGPGLTTVTDLSGSSMAANLGILTPVAGAPGTPIVGLSLDAKVTRLTQLSDLNGGVESIYPALR